MLSKDVAIVNGMVRTKDSVKVRDAVRPGLVQVGKTLFWHGREGDVVSVQGDIIILDIDGEKYKVRAGECESGTTGDSKTKDGEEQTIGNYEGYRLVFKNGFVRALEDGFTKFEVLSSMGNGGWTQADVKKLMNKIDARRSGMNDSYTQWRIVKSKNGKVIEEKSFQTSGDDSESFVKWREEKQKNSGLGNKLEMYQGNQLVATTDAEEPSTEGKSQDLAYIRKLIDEDVYGKGQRDSKTKDAGNCSNYRSDTESCRTGCKRIRVNPGEACPFDLETERGRWPGDFQADCPCYK
jgi:hypothetical protein